MPSKKIKVYFSGMMLILAIVPRGRAYIYIEANFLLCHIRKQRKI